jgi:hypothetical protein
MARPRIEINYDVVKQLATAQCTQEDIARILGVSISKCEKDPEFIRVYHDGKAEGRNLIITKQFEVAKNGNIRMLEWLGKQYCGQRDKIDTKTEGKVTVVIEAEDKDI